MQIIWERPWMALGQVLQNFSATPLPAKRLLEASR